MKPQEKTCSACGQSFTRADNRTDGQWASQKYCNARCAGDAYRAQYRASTPALTCEICGAPFWPSAKHRSRQYCERPECYAAHRALTGERISQRHKADYASGKRRRGIGLSRRETALWPLLASDGWVWGLYWIEEDAVFQLDFAHMDRKLNVEIDGIEHREPRNRPKDAERDAELAERGWEILRIPNADVDADVEAVAARITSWARDSRA